MTHPTKAIFKWLLSDYVKVSNAATDDMLYSEADLLSCYSKIQAVDYHQEIIFEGIKFTSYNAGHVLGAAMFLVEIAGVKVFYTGDFSREEDRHLMAAENPKCTPNVLVTESTYGIASHQPRNQRESIFTGFVHRVVGRGGRCLIPVFALGRAQELLLILDEYWQAHPELHNVPIYYASALAKKCMTVYQTYTNMMNERIRRQVKTSNPFQFKHISNLKSVAQFDDVGPCVMMASPGMLQSGLSRELFELWCGDKKNGVLIPGYVVEGTLGKDILSQPNEVISMNGAKLPLRMSIEYVSFSAHVDFPQNSEFIDLLQAPEVVLVHGESHEMNRLKNALNDKYVDRDTPIRIHTPRNCESVELFFRGEKNAKVIGRLAEKPFVDGESVSGLMIMRDYKYTLVHPEEIDEYAVDLSLAGLDQKHIVQSRAPFSLLKILIGNMFGTVSILSDDEIQLPSGNVYITKKNEYIEISWKGGVLNDMIADSVLSLVIQSESSRASVKLTKGSNHNHHHDVESLKDSHSEHNFGNPEMEEKRYLITQLLRSYFGDFVREEFKKAGTDGFCIWILDDNETSFTLNDDGEYQVKCEDPGEKDRIQSIVDKLMCTLSEMSNVLIL